MQIKYISEPILLWYNKNKRSLPFRCTKNPYKIWLSEVMLQQTRVNIVIPYYNNWIKRYPSVLSVANAKLSSLLKIWEGLGYYSRCKNFHQACKIVVNDFQGIVPTNLKDFKSLPGVGDYTASAVLSIAYKKPYPVIDTNVKRVLCRLLGIKIYNKYNNNRVQNNLTQIISKKYPGSFNQGLMEIGALICSTTNPACKICPIQSFCIAFQRGKPDSYPIKNIRKKIPHYEIVAGIIWRGDKFYVQRRNKEAMLGGLWEFPGGKVEPGESLTERLKRELKEECGFSAKINKKIGHINHAYSHFSISLHLFQCEENKDKIKKRFDTKWIRPREIHTLPFPKANHKLFKMLKNLGWYV